MLLDFIRMVNASQSFKIQDKFEFVSFEDVTAEHLDQGDISIPTELDIWAAVKITYDGKPPESYKALNLMIGDWVEAHLSPLTVAIHEELKEHFSENYPESHHEELDQVEDTAIWTDQLDYMPRLDESTKSMIIEIELVLNAEPIEEKPE
jgi:hypothetical protein